MKQIRLVVLVGILSVIGVIGCNTSNYSIDNIDDAIKDTRNAIKQSAQDAISAINNDRNLRESDRFERIKVINEITSNGYSTLDEYGNESSAHSQLIQQWVTERISDVQKANDFPRQKKWAMEHNRNYTICYGLAARIVAKCLPKYTDEELYGKLSETFFPIEIIDAPKPVWTHPDLPLIVGAGIIGRDEGEFNYQINLVTDGCIISTNPNLKLIIHKEYPLKSRLGIGAEIEIVDARKHGKASDLIRINLDVTATELSSEEVSNFSIKLLVHLVP